MLRFTLQQSAFSRKQEAPVRSHKLILLPYQFTSKYRMPLMLPSFFPSGVSRTTPAQSPSANCVRPRNCTVPVRPPGLTMHRSPSTHTSEHGAFEHKEKRLSLPESKNNVAVRYPGDSIKQSGLSAVEPMKSTSCTTYFQRVEGPFPGEPLR